MKRIPLGATALALLLPSTLFAQTVQKPTPGTTGTLPTPVIVNLYWETSHDAWNADQGTHSPTIERIDGATKALVHSGYFDGLSEYGITSVKFGKSIVLGDVCPSLAMAAGDTSIGHSLAGQVYNCIQPALTGIDPNNLLLNYLYPPNVLPGSDFGPTTGGYHDHSAGVASTWIPLSKNGSLRQVMAIMSHELVEAMTNIDSSSGAGYHEYFLPYIGSEIGDLCEGGSNGPDNEPEFSKFLQGIFAPTDDAGLISNYWSNAAQTCVNGMTNPTAPKPFSDSTGDHSISVCGRGENMQITLSFMEDKALSTPHLLPWDLGTVNVAPDGAGHQTGSVFGQKTMYLSATVKSNVGSESSVNWSAGAFLRVPTPDTIGFGNIGYHYFCPTTGTVCRTDITITGFDQDVEMAAGYSIEFKITDPYSGLSTNLSATLLGASMAQLWVTPPSGSGWSIFGDGSLIHGQMQGGQCGSSGPVEGQAAYGTTASYLESYDPSLGTTPFSAGMSDAHGMFQAPLVTDTAGKQTVNLALPATTINVDVHPSVTSMIPSGGYSAGNQQVTITGAGFAVPDQAPRTAVMVGSAAGSNVVVAPDGKSLSFTTPPGAGKPLPVIVYVDGVPSVAQTFNYCTPAYSCSQMMACNKSISDGCGGTIACGACGGGSACNSGSCCPVGQMGDGTGGCVCAPHHGCRVGTSWDPVDCYCSGSRF